MNFRFTLLLALVIIAGALLVGSTERTTAAEPSKFDSIDAGYWHTCGVTVADGAMCWGNNNDGQIGDGTFDGVDCSDAQNPDLKCRLTPVSVVGLVGEVSSISAGYEHTCAVVDGGAKCWGDNEFGQLGDGQMCGANDKCPIAVDVTGLTSGVLAIGAADGWSLAEGDKAYHSCALVSLVPSGTQVQCWGQNDRSQLGYDCGSPICTTPAVVQGLETDVVDMISVGYKHSCARLLGPTEGKYSIKCWGANSQNQIDQAVGDHLTAVGLYVDLDGDTIPDPVSDLDIVSFSAGGYAALGQTCVATTEAGATAAACTGGNQLDVGAAALTSGVVAISTAGPHACALMDDDGVKCWGSPLFGELGDDMGCYPLACGLPVDVCATHASKPCDQPGEHLTGAATIATGTYTSCALTSDGLSRCWGNNKRGQLGDGTVVSPGRTTPVGSDTDRDGCMDAQEAGSNPGAGGQRDPTSFWDFGDQWTLNGPVFVRDKSIVSGDVGAVIARFGTARGTPPTEEEALGEALTPPVSTGGYHASADVGAQIGPNPWDRAPADGNIVLADILAVNAQFGHTCA